MAPKDSPATSNSGRPVLLVGSVPLPDAEAVFSTAADLLGHRLNSVPDGETNERVNFILWQRDIMAAAPFLRPQDTESIDHKIQLVRFELTGPPPPDAAFGRLGYADAAIASYSTFRRLKEAGRLADNLRFQVSLPTPMAPVSTFIAAADVLTVAPLYARALETELASICDAIPAADLAIQWDVASEIAWLEGITKLPTTTADRLGTELARLGNRVPADVLLGYHLCYGDAGHQHFKQPADTGVMVDLSNSLLAGIERSVDWIHMPVPRDREDEAYVAPLARLALPDGCRLFLGLVHVSDGLNGTRRRMATAARVVREFGVATECGLGRRSPQTIRPLLELMAAAADT